jgi:hypothetical protein
VNRVVLRTCIATTRRVSWEIVDQSILDALQSVLGGTLVERTKTRDALRACLDLAPNDDPDATTLRVIVEADPFGTLDEFRAAFARIRARAVGSGTGRLRRQR